MRLFRRVLPEDEFWQLISLLQGSAREEAVGRLTDELRAGGRRQAAAFAERLAATLHDLDREALFRQPVRWSDDPEDAEPIPLSDDTFLSLRAAVVAQGKAVVDEVLADPAALRKRRWDDGEALLYAAEEAVGKEIATKHSYETGSNAEHWSPADLPAGPRPLVAVLLSDLLQPIEAYADEAMTVELAFHAWPLWFPMDVLEAASDRVDALVRAGGGLPASPAAEQIQISVGMGDAWQVVPDIEWDATDDTGMGQVVKVEVRMPQDRVRAWNRADQQAALLSLIASCCLAVLPERHGSRPGLRDAAAEGAHLLPEQ